MNKWLRVVVVGLLVSSISMVSVQGQVPERIHYQGRLLCSTNLFSGTACMVLRLYDAASGGRQLFEDSNQVRVIDGLYSTILGDNTNALYGPLAGVMTNREVWIESVVNGQLLSPREQFGAVPYALRSGCSWQVNGNADTHPGVEFIGTTDPQPLIFKVHAQQALRIEPAFTPNLIAGAQDNAAISGSVGIVIGGGSSNRVNGNYATISGGERNSASSWGAVIAGGYHNTATGRFSVVSGGDGNYAAGQGATVGGGLENAATTSYTTASGGYANKCGGWGSTIGGGRYNATHAPDASIVGGTMNKASGDEAFVGGGMNNGAGGYASAIVGGAQNRVSDSFDFIGGGAENCTTGRYCVIGGGRSNMAVNSGCVVGGHKNVALSSGAFIGGGGGNRVEGSLGVIGGGEENYIASCCGTIGGGMHNAIAIAYDYSSICGGQGNRCSSRYGFVGGGRSNLSTGDCSVVSGGILNQAESYSTVGGGAQNCARDSVTGSRYGYATVGGGEQNLADGYCAVVAGGFLNVASSIYATVSGGRENQATVADASVGGGWMNSASSNAATVAGGVSNCAAGLYAAIPGGCENVAAGEASLAAGNRAKALHNGSFVWGDINYVDIASTNANSWTVRCTGGARFISGIDETGGITSGVYLAQGAGNWETLSDRASKDQIQTVDSSAILEKLAAIPISTWHWKTQDASIRHIGPMAQDFHVAFGLGHDEHTINSTDADGVALAAIQGLYQALKERDAEIQDLKVRLHALESALPAR